MKVIFALAAVLILLAGCAGPQISAAKEETKNAPPAPVKEEPKNVPPPPVVEEKNETIAPPEKTLDLDSCTVQFQKDPNGVYYVMVKTESPKELFVRCPHYKLGEKRGNSLYFCSDLATGEPAVAFLDLKECGRAYFDRASFEKKASGPIACTVSVGQRRITVGGTTVVTVTTSTGEQEAEVSFNCGDQVKTQKRSGIVSDSQICKFSTPGTIEVWASLDGEVCASTLVEVFGSAHDCAVYGSNFTMDKGEYVYFAKLAGRGYSGTDELKYKCYDTNYVTAIREMPNSTDFVTTIECRGKTPLASPVTVRIADNNCGQIELPSAQ